MLRDRFFSLRNRLLCSARFRSLAQKNHLTQWLANRRAVDLFRISSGFIHSHVLLACVRLDLFERLRAGPLPVETIARDVGIDADRAVHLLRAAAALKLLERRSRERFGLGILGAAMVDNASVSALVEHHTVLYEDLADPLRIYYGAGGAARMSTLWPYAGSDIPGALGDEDVARYTSLMAASQAYFSTRHWLLDDVPKLLLPTA